MRRLLLLSALAFFSSSLSAQWVKINDADYVWGPFKIYNLSLFSETGEYRNGTRPLMLSLHYAKPVDGRDFAISLARSWSNLGITLPEQESVVDRLRKMMPNIREGDRVSYIALPERGYFIVNDTVIAEEFNKDFNDAVVAVWLDERVEIGRKLLNKVPVKTEQALAMQNSETNVNAEQAISAEMLETSANPNAQAEQNSATTSAEQAVENGQKNAEQAQVNNTKVEQTQIEPVEKTDETQKIEAEKPIVTEQNKVETVKEEPKAKAEEKPAQVEAVEYPNPETEILPPYDPIPFSSPFK